MGAKRKSYTPAYRRDAARLVIDTDRSIAQVAREIGLGEQLLGRWVATERAKMDAPPGALDADERSELERLRTENTQLRMDREFLKSSGLLRDGERVEPLGAFELIHTQKAYYDTTRMCELLGVSRSGYYAWSIRAAGGPSPRQVRQAYLLAKIQDRSPSFGRRERGTQDHRRPARRR